MKNLEELITILDKGKYPTRSDCSFFVNQVFSGKVDKDIITRILKLFNKVGYTSEQLVGFATSMRQASKRVDCKKNVVDNCGTGGDAMHTFNISTTASLIASCCKVVVAKHGNRSITSKSGSADLLSAAGIKINISPENVSDCIDKLNFGFMFAPLHHSSMRYVADSRKEIAPEKTIFNLLGPLTNPAGAKRQLIGVYDAKHMDMIAETLSSLGTDRAKVIHSNDGLDEVSLFDNSRITELANGVITSYDFDPSDYFNISTSDLCSKIRASILLMGPLLSRFKRIELPAPGGDVIGARRIDPHFECVEALGGRLEFGPPIHTEKMKGSKTYSRSRPEEISNNCITIDTIIRLKVWIP